MSVFWNYSESEGAYALTPAGVTAVVVLIALLVLLIAFMHGKREQKVLGTTQLVFSAAALALGYVASNIKIVHLPWGGSVTLCSMLFIALIGYWYGPKIGLTAGFAYGLLQFVLGGGSYILSPMQVCFDYVIAFAALGCSGFFSRKKNGLVIGYIVAILMRGLFHTIGGYLYWMDYMPEEFPKALAPVYPICYNYAYILAEGVLTILILCIPAVRKALGRIKGMAVAQEA